MEQLYTLLSATAALIALAYPITWAQWTWQWRDDKGHMIYSNAVPPPSVLPSRIIHNPNSCTATAYEALFTPVSGVKVTDSGAAAKPGQLVSGITAPNLDEELRRRLTGCTKRKQDEVRQAETVQRKQTEYACLRNEITHMQDGRRVGSV